MKKDQGYIDISESLRSFRNVGQRLNEYANEAGGGNGTAQDAVPYTMQDELMVSITETAKKQFGADFSQSDTPMLYYPQDGDVVLSGTIGDMNLRFQFRYKNTSGQGCLIWIESLPLTDEVIRRLSVVHGVYENWKKELTQTEDYKPMSMRNNNV